MPRSYLEVCPCPTWKYAPAYDRVRRDALTWGAVGLEPCTACSHVASLAELGAAGLAIPACPAGSTAWVHVCMCVGGRRGNPPPRVIPPSHPPGLGNAVSPPSPPCPPTWSPLVNVVHPSLPPHTSQHACGHTSSWRGSGGAAWGVLQPVQLHSKETATLLQHPIPDQSVIHTANQPPRSFVPCLASSMASRLPIELLAT